uniref:Uncharacterized protein n=1 Tax=Anguilla anguilla TaxID=7936 RepID=A0A0E9X7T2_ANGAN
MCNFNVTVHKQAFDFHSCFGTIIQTLTFNGRTLIVHLFRLSNFHYFLLKKWLWFFYFILKAFYFLM